MEYTSKYRQNPFSSSRVIIRWRTDRNAVLTKLAEVFGKEPKVRRIKYPVFETAAKGKSYRLYESITKCTNHCLCKSSANWKICCLFQHVAKCKAYDSYVALFPNAATTRDEKLLRLKLCNVMRAKKDALSYGYLNWTNMWTRAVLRTTAKFSVRNLAILYCATWCRVVW